MAKIKFTSKVGNGPDTPIGAKHFLLYYTIDNGEEKYVDLNQEVNIDGKACKVGVKVDENLHGKRSSVGASVTITLKQSKKIISTNKKYHVGLCDVIFWL